MAFGIEMLLNSLGLKPEEIKEQVGQIGQIVVTLGSTLIRIENRLARIEAHLGIKGTDAISGSGNSEARQSGTPLLTADD